MGESKDIMDASPSKLWAPEGRPNKLLRHRTCVLGIFDSWVTKKQGFTRSCSEELFKEQLGEPAKNNSSSKHIP